MSKYNNIGVLFIGGGILQSYAIEIAKRRGIRVYLTDVQNSNSEKTATDIINFVLGNSLLQISKIFKFIS